jgi:hypothetical protein
MFVHTARDANDGAAWAEQDAELGLFDAFFASLSIILVSEVSSIIHSAKMASSKIINPLLLLLLLFFLCFSMD